LSSLYRSFCRVSGEVLGIFLLLKGKVKSLAMVMSWWRCGEMGKLMSIKRRKKKS